MKGKFEDLINSEKPLLIDFYAEWCGPCKVQSPILKELAAEISDKVRIIKIDVDRNPEISNMYQIQSVPTLMIYRDGKQLFRQSGLISKPQLQNLLQSIP